MRYHYEKPEIYVSNYGKTYRMENTFRYSFKEFDDILPSGLIPRDPNTLVADEADLYREAIEQMEREIMWGNGRNYPKLDIESMYKTPGR